MALLVDLNQVRSSNLHVNCDVCVIGAGAAGLYLATRISRHGLRVIILEAGGAKCDSGASIGIEPIFSGSQYRGAVEGRAFGWGGSTSRWGGVLVPHCELDLRDDSTPEADAWKHITDVVRERSIPVFATLGLGSSPDFLALPGIALGSNAKLLHDRGLEVVAAEFVPFRRRNLTYLASPQMSRNVTIYLNAVASKWLVTPNTNTSGVVSTVQASSHNEMSLRVSARCFVVAAGAIESARILLEIDRYSGERMLSRSANIGCLLSDHLSCAIADVHPDDQSDVAKLFGPIFSKGRLRTFRFIGTFMNPFLPRHFAHFIFDINNSGFRLVKELLSGLQAKALPNLRVMDVIEGIRGLSRLAYDRFTKSRLFIPPCTPTHLQMDMEQTPDPANRVYLGEQTDRFGRPTAVIHWNVSDTDYNNIRMLSQQLLRRWPDRTLGFPRLLPIHIEDAQPKPYDAYHPVGTCRMGTDKEATVDLELKVRGTQNLYVLSTAVFPSAGTANPTFSMLCLADRLADQLAHSHADIVRSIQ